MAHLADNGRANRRWLLWRRMKRWSSRTPRGC
jgi:hypothetical protein